MIRNPEIAEIVPALLEALKEPASATDAALSALAHCQFEHCVDPPSLSLIVPVLHRGLRAPSAQACCIPIRVHTSESEDGLHM